MVTTITLLISEFTFSVDNSMNIVLHTSKLCTNTQVMQLTQMQKKIAEENNCCIK